MKKFQNSQILTEPISSIGASPEFLICAFQLGFECLLDFTKQEISELLKNEYFNYRMLTELLNLLIENGLENYIKD